MSRYWPPGPSRPAHVCGNIRGVLSGTGPDIGIVQHKCGVAGFERQARQDYLQSWEALDAKNFYRRYSLKAIKILGADRVCFGSDTPFELMHVELAKYRALLDGEISEADQALVYGGNVIRILNLAA